MTANKRFIKLLDTLHPIGDKVTGNPLSIMGAVDLLNKYDEDCKLYRNDALKAEKDKEILLEKNNQLNKENQALKNEIENGIESFKKLQKKRFEQYIIPGDIRDKATGMVYQCRTGNDGKALCDILNNLHEYNLDLHGEIKLINQEKREQSETINRLIHLCAEHNLNWQNEVEQ